MKKKRFTEVQIVNILNEGLAGMPVTDALALKLPSHCHLQQPLSIQMRLQRYVAIQALYVAITGRNILQNTLCGGLRYII